jgi:large subunit ribosomal protein L25
MTRIIELAAEPRKAAGSTEAKALRHQKRVPAVIYGGGQDPVTIHLEQIDVLKALYTGRFMTSLTKLSVNDTDHQVLARDVQLHPVKDTPMHVDFLRVTDKTRIKVEVRIDPINQRLAPGLEEGGILNLVRHRVEVICQATVIPEQITIDLDGMGLTDVITSSDVDLPDGVEFTIEEEFTIATITAPSIIEEPTEEEEEEVEGEELEGEEGEVEVEATEQGGVEDTEGGEE